MKILHHEHNGYTVSPRHTHVEELYKSWTGYTVKCLLGIKWIGQGMKPVNQTKIKTLMFIV